jgi:glucose-1-phosphate thymidylyltransferase
MIAVLLCAGFATRMYPLTRDLPKPLLEVSGRPVIDYLMDQIIDLSALQGIYVVSNAKFYDRFIEWQRLWKQNERLRDLPIEVINDGATANENRLGASADFQLVMKKISRSTPVLVSAGDNIYRFSIKPLYEQFIQTDCHYVVALPEANREKLKKTGVLELGDDDRVLRVFEKPQNPPSSWSCPPLYFFQPTVSGRLDEFLRQNVNRDAPGHFIAFLCRKDPVYAFRLNASRLDIGTIASYHAADRDLQNNPVIER